MDRDREQTSMPDESESSRSIWMTTALNPERPRLYQKFDAGGARPRRHFGGGAAPKCLWSRRHRRVKWPGFVSPAGDRRLSL